MRNIGFALQRRMARDFGGDAEAMRRALRRPSPTMLGEAAALEADEGLMHAAAVGILRREHLRKRPTQRWLAGPGERLFALDKFLDCRTHATRVGVFPLVSCAIEECLDGVVQLRFLTHLTDGPPDGVYIIRCCGNAVGSNEIQQAGTARVVLAVLKDRVQSVAG